MIYRVYTKDWYFNAGILGFLYVLSDGEKNIDNIINKCGQKLQINPNYLEFDTELLDDFYEKYRKLAFINFFYLGSYKGRVIHLISKLNEIKEDQKVTKKILSEVALNGKVVNKFFECLNGTSLEDIFNSFQYQNEIKNKIQNLNNILNGFSSSEKLYIYLNNSLNKSEFISYFLNLEVNKRICNYENIQNYLYDICNSKSLEEKNNNKICFLCNKYTKKYELNNAITQVIGFNKDNSNWIWGFYDSKVKICPLCALIYTCAVHGMAFIKKSIKGEYKTYFYFLNRNADLKTMYQSLMLYIEEMRKKENENKPYYTLLREITIKLIKTKAESFIGNIHFIEIKENEFGGQGTKSYNIYNFNITPELAEFVYKISSEEIPKGKYINKDVYIDVTEEIIKKTLDQSLSYSDLNCYFDIYIRQSVFYSLYKIRNYILKYINHYKGGNSMNYETIVKKGFGNGIEISQKIDSQNKLKGIAYQLLNDLKIGDKNAFMDKYLRLSMSYDVSIRLGSNNELTDTDSFMQFGYSFINGLLSKQESKEGKNG